MDNSASTILQRTEQLNREYQRTVRMVLSGGVRPADPLALWYARRDTSETPAAFLSLLGGMFGAGLGTNSCMMFGAGPFALSPARVRRFWERYVAAPADRSDPGVAQLLATVEGLPPTRVIDAGLDCLLDDTLRLPDRLQMAGVGVKEADPPSRVAPTEARATAAHANTQLKSRRTSGDE